MTLKSSEKTNANQYELEIQISPEDFNKEVDKVYRRDVKKINIPGFRKGKAPRAFVEKYYGEKVFFEDAINAIYPKAIDDAAKECGIEIVDQNIDLDIVTAGKKEGLVFKAKVTVMPEVDIEGYKGIEVSKKSLEVTEQDVKKELDEVRKRNGRLVSVEDRAAQMGDSAILDFEGFIDGKPFEGGKGENFTLELGKNQFISGFEEQIVGHNTGDEFEINVTFPEDYHSKEFQGKPAIFKIKLHEIKTLELPDLDDDLVKDISEFDTLDEYKKDLEKSLAEKKIKKAENDTEDEIINKLCELVKADIPEAMIKRKEKEFMRDFEYRLSSQGIKMDDYLKYTSSDISGIEESFKPQAERQVKYSLALKKIAQLEAISPSQEEVDEEYNDLAKNYNMDIQKVKDIIPKEDIERDVSLKKAMDMVKECVVFKEE